LSNLSGGLICAVQNNAVGVGQMRGVAEKGLQGEYKFDIIIIHG
jgi:hypothetical protein